jgi:SAM-dependent methyltransferase
MNSYLKLCTEFYVIDKPFAPKAELDFYLRFAEEAGGPIFEPMCGSGRFLVPLLQRGYDVDGADASPHMLEACREKLRRNGLSTNLYRQFLHELELPRRYQLAIIPAGSFQLVADMDQLRASLRRIHDLLLPGGKLVFECGQHKSVKSEAWPWGGRWVTRADGARIIISWLGRYDVERSISFNIHRYDLIKDGQLLASEFEEFDMRHYEADEVRALLCESGFDGIRIHKCHDITPPAETDGDVVFECRRA